MLLLTAKATREIVEAIEANTEALKRIEGKIDSQAAALKRVEDLIPTRGKERHDEDV